MVEDVFREHATPKNLPSVESYLAAKNINLEHLKLEDVYSFFRIVPKTHLESRFFNICKLSILQEIPALFLSDPQLVYRIFEGVDLSSEYATQNVQTLKEILNSIFRVENIFRKVMGDSKETSYFDVLKMTIDSKVKELSSLGQNGLLNYFAVQELGSVLKHFSEKKDVISHLHRSGSFEIFKGVTAAYDLENIDDEEIFISDDREPNQRLEDYLVTYGITSPEDIFIFKRFIKSPYRNILKTDFGIELPQLSPVEQIYVIKLISTLKMKDVRALKMFIASYGIYGLKAITSGEFKNDTFEKFGLIDLANFADTAIKDLGASELVFKLFKIYAELIESTDRIDDYILRNRVGKFNREEKTIFQRSIRKRSAEILTRMLKKVVSLSEQSGYGQYHQDIVKTEEYIEHELAKLKADNLMLGELFRFIKLNKKGASLSAMAEVKLETGNYENPKVKQIYIDNYTKDADTKRAETLYAKLLEDSQKPGFNFYSLRFNDEVIAFVYTLENDADKSVYIGGLNANNVEGFRVLQAGTHLMDMLENKYEELGYTVEAVAATAIASMHIKNRGFVGTRVEGQNSQGEYFFRLKKFPKGEEVKVDQLPRIVKIEDIGKDELNKILVSGYVISGINQKDKTICLLSKTKQ